MHMIRKGQDECIHSSALSTIKLIITAYYHNKKRSCRRASSSIIDPLYNMQIQLQFGQDNFAPV
jgi:hypothetical protein